MQPSPQRRYTVAEYLELESRSIEKHEYLNGEIFPLGSGPSVRDIPVNPLDHDRIVSNLQAELHSRLRNQAHQIINSEMRIKVEASGHYWCPDLALGFEPLLFEAGQPQAILNPTLIVEVHSPTSEEFDRGVKFRDYLRVPSVQELLLISQTEPLIEHYVRQTADRWLLSNCRGMDAVLKLPSIAKEIPLALIYANVEWPDAGATNTNSWE